MPTIKKLTFAPLFLIVFTLLMYQLSSLIKSYDFIFSLSYGNLIQLITLSALIFFSSLFFILFSTLASDWRIILPIGAFTCLIPFIFIETGLAIVLSVGLLVSLLLIFLNLENSLKSYLNFQPNSLLGPFIKRLSGLLILIICIVYFLSINKVITKEGFQIPDSLIDTSLKFTPQSQNAPQDLTNPLKQTIKDQFQTFIKPYVSFIPAILALLLFFTLQSLTSIVNLLVYPLLWLIFLILEKSGFIRFEEEQRTVKKLVV